MKRILFTITLIILNSNLLISQNKTSSCNCNLLKESIENDSLVIDLGNKIESKFNDLNIDGFNNNFNKKAFGENVFNSSKIDSTQTEYANGFIKGLLKGVEALPKKILTEIENGAYYNFISYEYNIVEKAYYITFRYYSAEGGVNYHDYKICSDSKNIMFNDIYIYLTGEHLSETYARLMALSLPKNKLLSLLFGKRIDNINKLSDSYKLMNQGNYKGAYNKINSIDGNLSKEKFILIMKSMIAANLNDKLYEEALLDFAQSFPEDPTLYLKQIDYYFLKGDFHKSMEMINKLQFETEDDFLNLLKGNVALLANNVEEAKDYYNYMLVNYPNLFEGYVGYITCLSYQEKFTDALEILDQLIDEGYDQELLISFLEEKDENGENQLENLVNSKTYKDWKKQKSKL